MFLLFPLLTHSPSPTPRARRSGCPRSRLLGVELTPTEAEMRTTHIHSQQLQFYGWDVLPAEQEAAAEGESAATEWKRHEHLKNVGARLPCPATVLRVPEAGLLLLAYHDRTAM